MVSVPDLMKDLERRNNFVDRTSQRRPVALKWRLPTTFHISHFSFLADVFLFKQKNIRDGVGTPLTLLLHFIQCPFLNQIQFGLERKNYFARRRFQTKFRLVL